MKPRALLLCIPITSILLGACSGSSSLPDPFSSAGSARPAESGYVEFYYDHALTLEQPLVAYIIDEGRETYLGRVATGTHRPAGRFECSVGDHVFTVRSGTAVQRVSARILDGMVTSIRVTVMASDSPRGGGISTAAFDLDAEVSEPTTP